jgi:hypothetical protein
MKRMPTVLVGAGVLLCLSAGSFGVASIARASIRPAQALALPGAGPAGLESPGGAECYTWTYPKNAICGSLSGKKECKSRPTVESSDDQKKREECQPTKGDICLCD